MMAMLKISGNRAQPSFHSDCRKMSRFLVLSVLLHLAAVPFLSAFLNHTQKVKIAPSSPVHQVTLINTPEDLPVLPSPPQPNQTLKEAKVKKVPTTPKLDILATSAPALSPQVHLDPAGDPLTVEKAGKYLSGLSSDEKEALIMNGVPGLPKKKLFFSPIKGPGNIFKSSITICTDNIDNDKDGPKDFNDPDCEKAKLEFNRSILEIKQILDASNQ